MNAQAPHKQWSTLKSGVFGSSSSLPPSKADLLSDHFDSKQSSESVGLPLTISISFLVLSI